MGIPPQAARIAGTWPSPSTQPARRARTSASRTDRSRLSVVARVLHPVRPSPAREPQPAAVPQGPRPA